MNITTEFPIRTSLLGKEKEKFNLEANIKNHLEFFLRHRQQVFTKRGLKVCKKKITNCHK